MIDHESGQHFNDYWEFDPWAIEALLLATPDQVAFPLVWRVGRHDHGEPLWVCDWATAEIARWIPACREALKLPLYPGILEGIDDVLGELEAALMQRLAKKKPKRKRKAVDLEDWAVADFQAEVEAVCGPGKRVGKALWFKCPFHPEKDASLEVDPIQKLFHCFSCDAKGGVYAWRKLTKNLNGS